MEKCAEYNEKLEIISEQISELCADKNKKIVEDFIGDYDASLEGFNQIKTWSLKKRLAPKNVIAPSAAKKNSEGTLVTGKTELENLYLETYAARLKPNQISEDLVELKDMKEYLFSIRKRLAARPHMLHLLAQVCQVFFQVGFFHTEDLDQFPHSSFCVSWLILLQS